MDYKREAADYLRCYKDLKISLDNLKDEIRELKLEIPGDVAISLNDMPGGSGPHLPDDEILNKMCRLEKAKEEYIATKKKLEKMDKIIGGLSSEGNECYEKVLRMWFIDNGDKGKPDVEKIAKELNYTERHVYRIKGIALRKFAIQLHGVKVID